MSCRMFPFLLGMLSGCALVTDADLAARMDLDGDAIPRPTDCDDDDANVLGPGSFHVDADGDGHGGGAAGTDCALLTGYVANDDDCDDTNAAVYPGAVEACDNLDGNCNGEADEGVVVPTWYPDGDGDGWGTDAGVTVCEQPVGYVAQGGDCDDSDNDVNPGLVWYSDADGDGYGDLATAVNACEAPGGRIADGTDCDDSRADVSPGAQEVCDAGNVDEDCDGSADDADPTATGQPLWYADADGDGLGTVFDTTEACDEPAGFVGGRADCDDANVDATASADCRWVEVSAGDDLSCGLRQNGAVQCWGANGSGQAEAPDDAMVSISAGWEFACGVRADASLICWGRDAHGQLDVPTGSYSLVSAEWSVACALNISGNLACWGDDNQYGYFDTIPATDYFSSVSVSYRGGCALSADGVVTGWAQFGGGAGPFLMIDAGLSCCGVDETGTVWQLNDGYSSEAYCTEAAPATAFVSISASQNHACGVTTSGSVECWGLNSLGQADPPPGVFRSVSAGEHHTCAITADGFIECWGSNSSGQTDAPTD